MSNYLTIPFWLLRRTSIPMAMLLLVALATSQASGAVDRLERGGTETCCPLTAEAVSHRPQVLTEPRRCQRSCARPNVDWPSHPCWPSSLHIRLLL